MVNKVVAFLSPVPFMPLILTDMNVTMPFKNNTCYGRTSITGNTLLLKDIRSTSQRLAAEKGIMRPLTKTSNRPDRLFNTAKAWFTCEHKHKHKDKTNGKTKE